MWDFSKAGWQDAVKEFFVSMLKTALVAIGSFLVLKLNSIHLGITDQNYEFYTALIVIGRSLISSFLVWVGNQTLASSSTTITTDTSTAAIAG